MSNEEKILALLEQMNGRLDKLEQDVSAIKADAEVIKEDEEIQQANTQKQKKAPQDTVIDDAADDEMLPQAIEVVVQAGVASTSLLQRRLHVGYSRAGRLIDELEARGIVGPSEAGTPRRILINYQQWQILRNQMFPDCRSVHKSSPQPQPQPQSPYPQQQMPPYPLYQGVPKVPWYKKIFR